MLITTIGDSCNLQLYVLENHHLVCADNIYIVLFKELEISLSFCIRIKHVNYQLCLYQAQQGN